VSASDITGGINVTGYIKIITGYINITGSRVRADRDRRLQGARGARP